MLPVVFKQGPSVHCRPLVRPQEPPQRARVRFVRRAGGVFPVDLLFTHFYSGPGNFLSVFIEGQGNFSCF